MYLYILDRLNQNHWHPIAATDYELAEILGISRNHIPGYRDMLAARGLIAFAKDGNGKRAVMLYLLPGDESNAFISAELNSTSNDSYAPESALKNAPSQTQNVNNRQKLTQNALDFCTETKISYAPEKELNPPTPPYRSSCCSINNNINNINNITTTTKGGVGENEKSNSPQSAKETQREIPEYVCELKKSPAWRESICMRNHIDSEELDRRLDDYVLFCTAEGVTHSSLRNVKSHFIENISFIYLADLGGITTFAVRI